MCLGNHLTLTVRSQTERAIAKQAAENGVVLSVVKRFKQFEMRNVLSKSLSEKVSFSLDRAAG